MTNEKHEALQQEWQTLHTSCDRSEALALGIKLLAVMICLATIFVPQSSLYISVILAVLWLQEAIWKTFQGRTEQRLLAIEKAWADNDNSSALCFYSHWTESRSGVMTLLKEYLSNAVRPTIAYPYSVLIVISLAVHYF